jgi:hypothetical protein
VKTCRSCPNTLKPNHTRYGYCGNCYFRWNRAGRPETGPPAPQTPQWSDEAGARGRAVIQANKQARVNEAARLLAKGYSRKRVAAYMALHIKTIDNYRRKIREQAAA